MKRSKLWLAPLCLLFSGGSQASEPPNGPAQSSAPSSLASFELSITVVRNAGTSQATERVHTLALTPDESPSAELRQGREVPVGDQYRNVGTNVQCRVRTRGERYLLWCAFEESTLVAGPGPPVFDTLNVVEQVVVTLGERVRLAGASSSPDGAGWSVSAELNEN